MKRKTEGESQRAQGHFLTKTFSHKNIPHQLIWKKSLRVWNLPINWIQVLMKMTEGRGQRMSRMSPRPL